MDALINQFFEHYCFVARLFLTFYRLWIKSIQLYCCHTTIPTKLEKAVKVELPFKCVRLQVCSGRIWTRWYRVYGYTRVTFVLPSISLKSSGGSSASVVGVAQAQTCQSRLGSFWEDLGSGSVLGQGWLTQEHGGKSSTSTLRRKYWKSCIITPCNPTTSLSMLH